MPGSCVRRATWRRPTGSFSAWGAGFVAVVAVAWLYQGVTRWWPLLPGGVLLLLAVPDAERIMT